MQGGQISDFFFFFSNPLFTQKEKTWPKNIQQYPTGYMWNLSRGLCSDYAPFSDGSSIYTKKKIFWINFWAARVNSGTVNRNFIQQKGVEGYFND